MFSKAAYLLTLGTLCLSLPVMADTLPAAVQDSDYRETDPRAVKLGQLLFYDPILSGNRNISCATCHHPKFATSDGVSLSLGEGGVGLGPDRVADPKNVPEKRIPRHSPALFNLGAAEFTVLFHDGRIEMDADRPSGLRTPMDDEMTEGFTSLLSAQTMFPVLSQDEMAGHYSENDVAKATRKGRITGPGGAWDIIAKRVENIPEYNNYFNELYGEDNPIAFTDISNVIADFIAAEWRSDTSPFDVYLRGQSDLNAEAQTGLELFYGRAGCSDCHSGPFQTDHGFHAMAVPQLGPGKAASFESHSRDTGRMRVTGRTKDAYKFRTPSLRNVTATGPYGHTGAYRSLSAFIKSHTTPARHLSSYDRSQAILPVFEAQDWVVMNSPGELAAIRAASAPVNVALKDRDVEAIIAFLKTLEDPAALRGRLGIPINVPSGLDVED